MYMRFIVALCLCAALTPDVHAQSLVRGHVVDAESGTPLAGVNISVRGSPSGRITDADGWFELAITAPPVELRFSHIGYRSETLVLDEARLRALETEPSSITIRLESRRMDLQPMVVTAGRYEAPRTDAPVAIAAISARELEERRPNNLSAALSTVAGVHMTDLGNEQHNMSIRQPLSYKALFAYLEDGIPIRPIGIFNHNALIEVNMAAADRIEVVRGPSSSLYGANAIGGAVNFVTARPSEQPHGAFALRADNHGYQRADLEASATSGRLGVWAGGYGARQRGGWAEHSDFDKLSLSLRADYAFTPRTRLVTTYSANHLDTDTSGNLDSLSFFGDDRRSLQTFTNRAVEAHRLTSRLRHVWMDGRHSSELALYWRRNRTDQLPHYRIRNDLADPSSAWGEENSVRFRSLGMNLQHQADLGWRQSRIIAGATFEHSPNTDRAYFIDITRDPQSGRYIDYTRSDSLLTDYAVDLVSGAAYAQLEVEPIDRIRLVGSLRLDEVRYHYRTNLPPSAHSGPPDADDRFTRLSPRLGMTFDAGNARGLYANYSQGFVPPEISELYRGVRVPSLRPASFHSYEIGGWAAWLGGRLLADASVYRMDGVDEIITVRLADGSSVNRNAGRTRHLGVEYALTYAPARWIDLRLTGSNARHTFITYEDGGVSMDGNSMDAAPGWIANASAVVRPPFARGLRLAVEWEHIGPYYMDPQNTTRYAGYDLVHLRAGYTVRGVELWMNVRNLTDELHATIATMGWGRHQYHPGAPRSVSAGLSYSVSRR